jgi:hypothetical protein
MGTAVADINGNWSFTTPTLGEGHTPLPRRHQRYGHRPDLRSNRCRRSTAPNTPGVFNADGSVLTGQAEAGSTVSIRMPDGTIYTTTANGSGTYTCPFAKNRLKANTDADRDRCRREHLTTGTGTAPTLPLSAANNVDELNFTTTATVTNAQYSDYGFCWSVRSETSCCWGTTVRR